MFLAHEHTATYSLDMEIYKTHISILNSCQCEEPSCFELLLHWMESSIRPLWALKSHLTFWHFWTKCNNIFSSGTWYHPSVLCRSWTGSSSILNFSLTYSSFQNPAEFMASNPSPPHSWRRPVTNWPLKSFQEGFDRYLCTLQYYNKEEGLVKVF